jgi:hypothetical protein
MQMLPYAEMFPGMSDEDFIALNAKGEEDGLEKSIVANEENTLNERNRFTACPAAGITMCIFPVQDKSSVVIYDIFDAGFGPVAYPLDTLKPLIRGAREVFVWNGEPSAKQCQRVLGAAVRDGVAVVVHTIPKHALSWRHTFERIARTDNRTGSNGR